MKDTDWKKQINGTYDEYWIDLLSEDQFYRACVKADGCIHFYQSCNGRFNEEGVHEPEKDTEDYIHICDVEQWIERLTSLRDWAKRHFGEEWNV